MARKFEEHSLSMPVLATAETLGLLDDKLEMRVIYALAGMYADDMWQRKRTYHGLSRADQMEFTRINGPAFYDRMCKLLARNLRASIMYSKGLAECGS